MGCASSVQVFDSPSVDKEEEDDIGEGHAEICKCLDVNKVEDVRRKISVLTMKSGNLKMNQTALIDDGLEALRREVAASQTPQSSPLINGVRARVIDSPAPFRKTANGTMVNSPSRMRIRNGNPYSSPHANRNAIPLVEQEEDSDEETKTKSSKPEIKSGHQNHTQQNRLNKALLELGASLSESHGNAFQLEFNHKQAKQSLPVSPLTIPTYGSTNHNKPEKRGVIVIDAGSGLCKAGFSSEDMPSIVIPMLVGRPSTNDVIPGANVNTTFVGNDVKLRKNLLSLSKPKRRGVVQNWDDWSAVLDHVLNMELKLDKDHISVVLPGSLLAARKDREKQVELMFEKFHVEKLYLGSRAPMALHAFGMTSGLLVNVGHDVTSCVPVLNGNVQSKGVRTLQLGGSDITKRLQTLIQNEKEVNNCSYEKDDNIDRVMMERLCCVSSLGNDQETNDNIEERNYVLPNGTTITLQKERCLAPEILFNPQVLGDEYKHGIHEMCIESVTACQETSVNDVAATLYKNVVLSGGASLLPGLGQRLEKEISDRVSSPRKGEVKVHSLPKRQYATWRGAAHMTSLQLSRSRWMTKSEYEEHGASIIHGKYL